MPRTIPIEDHIAAPQIVLASNAWTTSWLTRHFRNDREPALFTEQLCAWWAAVCYPHGSLARTLDVADMAQCLTSIDDAFTRDAVRDSEPNANSTGRDFADTKMAREVLGRIITTGSAEHCPDDLPLAQMYADLWNRMRARISPGVSERWKELLGACRGHVTAEHDNLRNGKLLDYDALVRIRCETIHTRAFAVLTEYAMNIEIPAKLTSDRRFEELSWILGAQTAIVNDVYSYRKECVAGDWMANVITAARNEGLSLQSAVDKVCRHADDLESQFCSLRDELISVWGGRRPDIAAYLRELGYLILGSVAFERGSSRYHGPGFVWDGNLEAMVTFHTDRTEFTPANGDHAAADSSPDMHDKFPHRSES
ncbi:terpene synthase family protein [Nocardia sp. NPDC088792]|uniref:terpene synthase family protein n=1 Tax=Nocardia sp. NPDC088792 TaxID=3364332 RepID=UPI0037F2D844